MHWSKAVTYSTLFIFGYSSAIFQCFVLQAIFRTYMQMWVLFCHPFPWDHENTRQPM